MEIAGNSMTFGGHSAIAMRVAQHNRPYKTNLIILFRTTNGTVVCKTNVWKTQYLYTRVKTNVMRYAPGASLAHAVTRTNDGSEMKHDIELTDISALVQLLWLLLEVLYFINTQKRNSVRLNPAELL